MECCRNCLSAIHFFLRSSLGKTKTHLPSCDPLPDINLTLVPGSGSGIDEPANSTSIQVPKNEGEQKSPISASSYCCVEEEQLPPSVSLPASSHCCEPVYPVCRNLLSAASEDYLFTWQKLVPGLLWVDVHSCRSVPKPYTPTVDDVGCYLRMRLRPLGSPEKQTFSDISVVGISKALSATLTALLVLGNTAFSLIHCDATGQRTNWKVHLNYRGFILLKKASAELTKVHDVKWSPAVDIVMNPAEKDSFTIHFGSRATTFSIDSIPGRDLFVLAFRLFHAVSLPDLCRDLLGEEVWVRWSKGKMAAAGGESVLTKALRGGETTEANNNNNSSGSVSSGHDKARNTLASLKASFAMAVAMAANAAAATTTTASVSVTSHQLPPPP